MWRSEVNAKYFSLVLVLRPGLLELGATWLHQMASKLLASQSLLLQCWDYRHTSYYQALNVNLGWLNSAPHVAITSWHSHFLIPCHSFIINFIMHFLHQLFSKPYERGMYILYLKFVILLVNCCFNLNGLILLFQNKLSLV